MIPSRLAPDFLSKYYFTHPANDGKRTDLKMLVYLADLDGFAKYYARSRRSVLVRYLVMIDPLGMDHQK